MARRAFAPKLSKRDQALQSNKWDAHYAAMFGKTPQLQVPIPEKRIARERVAAKKSGLSELQEQIRVINWWDQHCVEFGLPFFALFAIPNGGGRQLFDAANLKRSGTRKGVEDLLLSVPKLVNHGLFIEMKIVGEKQSDEQMSLQEFHLRQGYHSVVCFSHLEAIEAIQDYLIPF